MSAQPVSPDPDQGGGDTQTTSVGSGDQSAGTDQSGPDTHVVRVGSGPSSPSQGGGDTHMANAGGSSSAPAATIPAAAPTDAASRRDADLLLYLYADQLDDVENLRVATENRIRTLLSQEEWGKAVNPDLPEVQVVQSQLDQLKALEHGITLALKRAMRAHYLADYQKNAVGVGEKQLGRLLAQIGDPATRDKPSQLWAYCGLHVWNSPADQRNADTHGADVGGVAPTRTRGRQANWNTDAKTRVYLVAKQCVMAGVRSLPDCDDSDGYDVDGRKAITPYGETYLYGRRKYADATHTRECKRCGPKGKPAQPGSELSDGHQNMRAMRLVMKGKNSHAGILLDLWKAA